MYHLEKVSENGMVASTEKFQLMFLGANNGHKQCLNIDDQTIKQC